MKSALIITGNLRSFENCYKTFEQLIEKLDCDIFICMSNVQFDLHPYQKQINNFYSDCVLTENLINSKLNICKNINNKTKKIFLLDKVEEDNEIINDYLHKFDNKKEWKGIDIFKQYNKLNKCVDFIKKYEIENNLKYNYIMKTRFDIDININSLPSLPLSEKTFYSNIYSNNLINDICLISNSIDNFEIMCNELNSHFFNNYADINVYQSIHSLLYYIFKSNNFNSIQSISSDVNRTYSSCFDTNITLVTCFYNIGREKWKSCSRSTDKYFENAKNILNKHNPIVIFTTQDYVNRCIEIRKITDINLLYTKIIVIPFEELMYYDKINLIKEIQQNNLKNLSYDCRQYPEFCVPEYIIVINNKINFLKKVSDENIFNSKIFQWVDFGLHHNVYNFNEKLFNEKYFSNIFYKKDKIRIVSFELPKIISNRIEFYNTHSSTVACGLFGGDINAINMLYSLSKNEFEYMLNNNIMNQEQYIYYYLMCQNLKFFDYSIINNWNDLCESYFKNNTKIAICMSGHTRTFNECKDNIANNIIKPLVDSGYYVNTFFSTWDDIDYNNNLQNVNKFCTEVNAENYNSNFFTDNFSTKQYLQYPGLCCHTTSSNAASSHYKIKNSYDLAEKYSEKNKIDYDIIIRIRPDIIYNNMIDIGNIKDALLNDYLYMPNSHGKYTSVTKNIMDHFFYGNINTMKKIINTFNNIPNFLKLDNPHTVEGFLYSQLFENNIIINRFMLSYGVIRKNNNYEKIYC
jgi:hypothetical protein